MSQKAAALLPLIPMNLQQSLPQQNQLKSPIRCQGPDDKVLGATLEAGVDPVEEAASSNTCDADLQLVAGV